VKRRPGSPPVFKARYVARGFSQREGVDFFQTFAPTPKMTTLRGSLHEEVWLRRPSAFTGSFPPETQWRLRRPVYGLRQAPREWHDTLRSTLSGLGFQPSFADPSLFVRRGSTPFFVLGYVLQRFELQHSTVQRTLFPLTTDSPDPFLTSRLSLVVLTQSLWAASWRQDVVLTGHCDSSYADDAETHRSTQGYCFSLGSGAVSWRSTRSSSVSTSSAEAEIYAGAMAAQELRWLTFLLTDLSERPSSAPTLFTDNKATILLCQEPRLESRVKHINVR
ncbi:unnamed protein product, partial [Closterium sp. NIES-53]